MIVDLHSRWCYSQKGRRQRNKIPHWAKTQKTVRISAKQSQEESHIRVYETFSVSLIFGLSRRTHRLNRAKNQGASASFDNLKTKTIQIKNQYFKNQEFLVKCLKRCACNCKSDGKMYRKKRHQNRLVIGAQTARALAYLELLWVGGAPPITPRLI